MWLECVVEYWDDDPDSPRRKLYKRHILTNAVNYTEAETVATSWATEQTSESFEIAPIKLLDISSVIPNSKAAYFFKVDTVYYEENSRGKLKAYKHNLMIQANDPEQASAITKNYLETHIPNESEIKKVTKTEIEEIV